MNNSSYHTVELAELSFLVTGGAGFIGSHISEYLLSSGAKKVRVLDNLSTGFEKNIKHLEKFESFEFVEGDIRDMAVCQSCCKGIDYVSHQAALGSVPRSIDDPITTNEVNVSGFLNVLVAAKDAGVRRVVYAASSSTYGDSPSLPKVEDSIGRPLSPYAVTKYVNELYADIFYKVYQLESIGLRYFNVFGPRQNPKGAYAAVIPLFIDAILNNTAPKVNGDGEQTRDFTYVENVIQANMKSLLTTNAKAVNQVYNVAVGERISLNGLVEVINELEVCNVRPQYGPSRKGDVQDSLADISKAKMLLNYTPSIKLVEGLKLTLDWFKASK